MPDRRRSIEVEFLVDDSDKRKLKGIGDEAGTAVGKFDGLKGAVGGFLTVAAVQQVGQMAFDLAKLGEQAGIAAESASKVLGPALAGLQTNLEDTRLTMGLNSAELDGLIAQYGLMTESLGLNDEAQAEFIEWLIKTGGELAAFKGDLSLSDEAVDALGATLRGEYDSLEQFGVKVSDAAVEEQKLKLAADPANAALSDQQLELLALQTLINEKARPAIGSLASAQDGMAGKTNAATARFEDMKIELGQKVQPVLESVIGFLLESIEGMENLSDPGKFQNTQLAQWLRDLDAALGPIDEAIGGLIDSFGSLGREANEILSSVEGAVEEVGRVIAGKQGSTHAITNPNSPTYIGRRQHGGSVGRGNAYLVGERGPEVFTPSSNGHIGTGGGMVANITINAGIGSDPNAISRAVVQALQRYERANGAIPVRGLGR